MNKRIVGCCVLVVGVAALSLSVVLKQQFGRLVTDGSPEAGGYPLLEWVAPEMKEPAGSAGAGGAAELATRISRRIYGIGTLGGILLGGGVWLIVSPRRV